MLRGIDPRLWGIPSRSFKKCLEMGVSFFLGTRVEPHPKLRPSVRFLQAIMADVADEGPTRAVRHAVLAALRRGKKWKSGCGQI